MTEAKWTKGPWYADMPHFCPVCRREECGHMLKRDIRREVFDALRPFAETPLDLGVARFAADVLALTRGES